MHILHLEDSVSDSVWISALLESQLPDCTVTRLASREEFEAAAVVDNYDLVLSDYSLPRYDGLKALAFVQSCKPDKPFIYFSGTIGEEKAIQALKSGAVDYVVKDRPARLVPAILSAVEAAAQVKAREVAERKVREQASLLDRSREAICVTDVQGIITYWNASAERLYGCSAAEVEGRSVREMLYAGDQARFDAAWASVQAKGEWRGDLRPQACGGGEILVDGCWSLVMDESGQPKSVFMIDTDITEKRRMESQLLESQRLETLGLLVGGIAHDLNNMLAPIITAVDLMHAQPGGDPELLRILDASAHHVADLVGQLLAHAKGREGHRGQVAVDDLVSSARRLLRGAMPVNIQIDTFLGSELWPVLADATQLRQVLLNLCLNARDAMPNGGLIEIRAEDVRVDETTRCVQGEAKPGRYVRLSVTDNGSGIPEGVLHKIFTPFFTTKQAGKGTGLGLPNVAGIVKAHGGFLNVESTTGVGTAFHVYLPAFGADSDDSGNAVAPRQPMEGRGEEILVIEDDEGIRTVLEIILSTRGYRTTMAGGGEEGVRYVQEDPNRFALVLTDWHMPEMGGAEVIQKIRELPVQPKIIVLSGAPEEWPTESPELRGVEFLRKPLTVESLLASLRQVLHGSQPTAG